MKNCIGLFGTCGDSTWRQDIFIPKYLELGMKDGEDFFNPQVDDWKPELAAVEAEHLAQDAIILFPVTGETYGTGSLGEVGFSILQAIKLDDRRDFVIYIEKTLDQELEANPDVFKESMRLRNLQLQHLRKIRLGNLFVIPSELKREEALNRMCELSILLKKNLDRLDPFIQKYSSLFQDPTK